MLDAAAGAAKGQVDPKTVVGVAKSSPDPGSAVTNVQAIAHSGNMVKLYDTLKGADPSEQAQGWQGLSGTEQESLKSLGYQPPNLGALTHAGAGGQHGGIWSSVLGGVSDALHTGESAVGRAAHDVNIGQVPGRVVGDTLNAAASPLRAVQHVYRASNALSETGMHQQGMSWQQIAQKSAGSGVDLTQGWSQVFDPSSWAKAWDMTTNGNTSLDPAQNHVLVQKYGQKQVTLALKVANEGPDAAIAAAPQNQRQALIDQTRDPKFMQLVTQVSNAKVSTGRSLVGSRYMDQHPAAGKALSGAIDGVVDIGSDPTMKIGKVADLLREAGTTGAAFDRIAASAEPDLAAGRYATLGKRIPQLEPITHLLRREGVTDAQGLKDTIKSVAGQAALMAGGAPKIADGAAIIPHLTPLGWTRQGVKNVLSNSLDSLMDKKIPAASKTALDTGDVNGLGEGAAHAGQMADVESLLAKARDVGGPGKLAKLANPARKIRQLSTLISTKPFLNIADAARDEETGLFTDTGPDVANFRRFIQGFMRPAQVDDAADLFLNSEQGIRRSLVNGLIRQHFELSGLTKTDDGQQAAETWMGLQDELMRKQAYSVNGYDTETAEDGLPTRNALIETQLSPGMRIPMPNEIRQMVRRAGVLGSLGVNPVNRVDEMMAIWRAAILDRPGFAVRIVLDENGNRTLRLGVKNTLASEFAGGARVTRTDEDIADQVQREIENGQTEDGKPIFPEEASAREATLKGLANKPFLPYHPGERVLRVLAEHAPKGLRPHMQSFEHFYGAVFGGAVRRWARQAERKGLKAFGMDRYVAGAENFAKYQDEAAQGVLGHVLGRANGDEGNAFSPEAQASLMRDGGKGVLARVDHNSPYSVSGIGDPFYHVKYQTSLDQIAHSQPGRAVLESIDQPRATQVEAAKGVLTDPSFAVTKKAFVWDKKLLDGRVVGNKPGDATQAEADESFASQIVDHVNAHVRSGIYSPTQRGPVLHDVVDHMLSTGKAPDIDMLEGKSATELPHNVVGPDIVPVNKFDGFFKKSFEQMVGRPMNWLARQPHFIHLYTDALDDARSIAERAGATGEHAEKLASDLAMTRAVNQMIPFIHNPELRTQFEDLHRNLFPFLFAQRQFLQRWARTFADSPEAIRKLQLTMNGLRTSGVVQNDSSGNAFFYYPGSQYVTEMIAGAFNRVGVHTTVPFSDPFSGQVQYLIPGLSNPVTPSVGPFAAVAMNEAQKFFPEITGFNNKIQGEGAGQGVVQDFLPSILNRLYEALGPQEAGSQLMTSAAQYVKYMDAAGQGLPNDPKQGDIEKYVDRITSGARSLLLARTALGFVLPATPTANLDPEGIDARYKFLLSVLPYDQATAEFVKEYPTAQAYSVGSTTAETEGGLPSTQADLDWTNKNLDFTSNYPAAAPWFAPRSPGTFSLTEFEEQLNTGERQTKPLYNAQPGSRSVITDIINARASGAYYQTVDNYENAYANASGSAARSQLTNQYDTWKQDFFTRNPVFEEYIASNAGHTARVTTLNQVTQALKDPATPASPVTDDLRTIMDAYASFQHQYASVTGSGSQKYDAKTTIQANMIAWINSSAKAAPDVADFLTTIIRPEVDEVTG
jgi:hypothetical protein